MKKTFTITFALILLILANFSCKKDKSSTSCAENRTDYLQVNNQEGYIRFSSQNARYYVYLDILPARPGNIDSHNTGYFCDLPAEYRTDGMKVRVSGTLKNLNGNDKIEATIGGESPYFFDYTSINKATDNWSNHGSSSRDKTNFIVRDIRKGNPVFQRFR